MDRRSFMTTSLAAGTAISMGAFGSQRAAAESAESSKKGKFKLKYAPHFGMFVHHAGKSQSVAG